MRSIALTLASALLVCLSCFEYGPVNPFDPNHNGGQDPFSLSAIGDTVAVCLSWNRMDAEGFERLLIYRDAGDSSDLTLVNEIDDQARTSWIDSGLSPDTTYYYRMSMIAGGRESNPSDIVSALPLERPRAVLVVTLDGLPADTLDYGVNHGTMSVAVSDTGPGALRISDVDVSYPWIEPSWTSADIGPGESRVLRISIARDSLDDRQAPYTGTVTIVSNGGTLVLHVMVTQRADTPLLRISPDSLDFDSSGVSRVLRIANDGNGTMRRCTLTTTVSWVSFEPPALDSIEPGASREISVLLDRGDTALGDGENRAYVMASSDGGDFSVPVRVYKPVRTAVLSVSTDTLDFDTARSSLTLTIRNDGNAGLDSAVLTSASSWLSFEPDTVRDIGVGQSRDVTVLADRASMQLDTGLNSAVLTVSSPVGDRSVAVLLTKPFIAEAYLSLQRDTLDFGETNLSLVQVLTNIGTLPLHWSLAAPDEAWLAFDGPTSGSLGPDSSVSLTVRVLRDSLAPGPFAQEVSVQSTEGGNRTFVVKGMQPDLLPPNASALNVGDTGAVWATLTWTACEDDDFAYYRLFRNTSASVNSGDHPVCSIGVADSLTVTDTGLTSLTAYHYILYTYDQDGLYDSSNVVAVETKPMRVLTGTVRANPGSAPLAGVTVAIAGSGDSVTSGTDGVYRFENPAPGPADIHFVFGGYLRDADTITIADTGRMVRDAELRRVPELTEVATAAAFDEIVSLAVSDNYAFVLDQSLMTGAATLVVVNLATGTKAASKGLQTLAPMSMYPQVGAVGDTAYVACPEERLLVRISPPWGTLIDDSQVDTVSVGFEPFDMRAHGDTIWLAGVNDADRGALAVVSRSPLGLESVYESTMGAGVYDALGPRIAEDDGYVYVSSGVALQPAVARFDKAVAQFDRSVNLPWSKPSAMAAAGGAVYVASDDGDADSLMVFDSDLQ
ncbi:MAG: hypothetical protein GF331_15135, partial [Chitinivibrionales bacterium]|nr:hypothetical protein [Chitinivibrionales bacterium]